MSLSEWPIAMYASTWRSQEGVWRWSIGAATYALALDDAYLYWSDQSAVRRSRLAGGNAEIVCPSAASLLLDGSCLYLMTLNREGALLRVSTSGGPATSLATWTDALNTFPDRFAVDPSGVYWIELSKFHHSGRIMRLAK